MRSRCRKHAITPLVLSMICALMTAVALPACGIDSERSQSAVTEPAHGNETSGVMPKIETPTPEPPWWEDEDYQDFLPAGRSLFVNRAQTFYYYEQLQAEERLFYDAMLAVLKDPTTTKYHKRIEISMQPGSDEYAKAFDSAKEALIYDHPEMFWLRETNGFNSYFNGDKSAKLPNGKYLVMIELLEPYDTYQADMQAFNNAAQELLGTVDLSSEQPFLALEIHDALIDLVSYDGVLAEETRTVVGEDADAESTEMREEGEASGDGAEDNDRGHTAYGALVANSRGEENRAVCDGYAYALLYLWQQAGITATVINGSAGDEENGMELHAWNALCLDGAWYEVDATWNDSALDDILELDLEDENNAIYAMALEDPSYTEPVRHYMYALTTEQMSDYTPEEVYRYDTEHEYMELDLGATRHVRTTAEEAEIYGEQVSLLAPVADGTTYTYDALMQMISDEQEEAA